MFKPSLVKRSVYAGSAVLRSIAEQIRRLCQTLILAQRHELFYLLPIESVIKD